MNREKNPMKTYYKVMESPIGNLGIVANDKAITQIVFEKDIATLEKSEYMEYDTPLIAQAFEELEDYFSGMLQVFTVPIEQSGTIFQQQVWQALCEVPYGETVSYKSIAIKVGNPNASRAVGMANNRNKIPIIVPCHRIVGSNGNLIGYAGGVDKKEILLSLEIERGAINEK